MQSSKEERRPAAWGVGDHEALFAGLPLGGGETLGLPVTESQTSQQTQAQQRTVIKTSAHLQQASLVDLGVLSMALQPPVSQQGPTQQPATMSTNQSGGGVPTSAQQQAMATATAAAAVATSSQFQRLKVEDALSYLDQVKLQFGNQPQVYNDFLDIMKEFKSQSIDTPGVISRVSNLFKGHPDLIVGFNTFLPPGFKIEVHHNEINISGPAQHSHALQKIAQQHNNANNAALASQSSAASPSSQTKGTPGSSTPTSSAPGGASTSVHQPVEFNHAINYVNKIKNRFQQHPDIYKAFLEILHTYQKEQRAIKEGATPSSIPLSETEVYSQVSKLFQNQDDLLSEFGQFLPDATAHFSLSPLGPPPTKKPALSAATGKNAKPAHGRKASQSGGNSSGQGQSKKPKSSAKDVLAEAGKHTNYAELALFDKIRKALRNQEVYENFLRCLVLFNEEIVSRQELVHLVTPFLGKYPELFGSFKTLLGFKDPGLPDQLPTNATIPPYPPKERVTEFAAEIDFNSLKRHGASYRALPKTYVQPKCSGRTQLCREVLNDTWVSFPMWSEDSTFQGTRKTQYEEYIFRCEDERFELDVVLENNLSTIRYLEGLQKKMSKMGPEEVSRFTLDNTLGGISEVLQRKAIHRIYGDKAPDIIDGLRKSPSVAVPVVLKRLKSKQEEWIEAQKSFNKQWREQLEKYYLKSLDHQGITFKATDTRAMRSKSLIGDIETIFDERQEQLTEGASTTGPHLQFTFPEDHCVFSDAVALVMYYMKRASSLQREDAIKIRSFLTHTLADFCFYPRVEVSNEDDLSAESDTEAMEVDLLPPVSDHPVPVKNGGVALVPVGGALVPETMPQFLAMDYHVIFTNNALYTFFRLFQFLCERLNRIYQQSLQVVEEEGTARRGKGETIAIQLGLKRPPDILVEEHYPTFLNMAKNYMEGNIDCTTYEDTCREMFGVHAFVVFTIDRLVQNTVRQLHTIVADDGCYHVMEQYSAFVEQLTPSHMHAEGRAGLEVTYQRKVEAILGDDNSFKIVFNKKTHKMTFELLDTEESSDENNCPEMKKWQSYVEKYSKPEEEASPELRDILANRKIFMKRNCRTWPHTSSSGEEDEARLMRIHLPEMEIFGAIEFKMDKKSYRMIPLANSEDYLYNKQSLKKANEVNRGVQERKSVRFRRWLSQWLECNVSQTEEQTCRDWLMGPPGEQEEQEDLRSQCIPETFLGCERNRYITVSNSTPTA